MLGSPMSGSLSALLFNARSIRNKFLEFVALLTLERPDLVAVTESWVRTSDRDFEGEYAIPGYQLYHRDRTDRAGGGVMLYIRDSLKLGNIATGSEHEFLGVDLEIGHAVYRIIVVYRPPHQTIDRDRALYGEIRNLIDGKTCVLLGDFNSHVDWETGESPAEDMPLLEFVNDNFLTQWVREPTRGNNILDLVLTTEDDIVTDLSTGEELGSSDHRLVRFTLQVPETHSGASAVRKFNFRRADFPRMRTAVRQIEVDLDADIEVAWSHFKDDFMRAQSDSIPLRSCRGSTQNPRWLSGEIKRAIGRKRRAYRQATETGEYGEYHRLRRRIKTMIRAAKRNEEMRVARLCKENPKEFFRYVNSRKPIKRKISPLVGNDGELCFTDPENADLLNDYFSSVFTVEDDHSPEPIVNHEGDSLDYFRCTPSEVAEKIDKLNRNKSPGTDGFLPRVLKEVKEEVVPQLTSLFNRSLETGVVPGDWREANVTPIFKKGSDRQPCNYRPVSLTSIVCKLLEGVLVDRIVDHLDSHRLLKDSQLGFRRHRSCLTNLLEFFHNVFSEHDRSKAVDVIYLDFEKAFDKVPYRRLLSKLRALGVGGEVARWIENWLSGRRQRVVVNGSSSEWSPVTSGVPQGSVLGPLLFIVYINDIDEGIVSRISKFADDTKLGMDVSNPDNVERLKQDMERLGEWSEKWQMPFNLNKCKVMHIGYRNPNTDYVLQGQTLQETDSEVHLGLVITSDLKPSKQCIEAEKKAQRILGYIKRQFGYRNKEIVLNLYNSLVRPRLEYAVQFWSPSYRKDIDRLERVQARATKLIPELRNKSYQERLAELNLFSLETRRLRGQLIETFKFLRGFNNVDFRSIFQLSEGCTRNHGYKIELKRYNGDLCGNFFSYKIGNYWNALPPDVVNSNSVDQFKTRLDKVLHRL